ncbi:lysylphosphatidylglycerol synthase transmembrane domain-containing protein [Muriicola sp. Z0-33]|uniref:lysylphosphatidylglycerol synthase transmembrane domain-containing protein n=1 Tax=Muriicola sp. Z0-33 TaxID=2816957 RepID=UPI002238AB8D|nr:lysylphosphatidylglycerol synthase transmembrane domain-containing protein [Muriicola sp. Z0-33]MCW5515927.1 flippase-like domain-containing protein [Muriicola sp. Z0-33]
MAELRKKGITVLKIVISAVLIYFIFTKIQLQQVLEILRQTDPFYLLLAVLFFVVSKIMAAFRLNLYFYQLHVFLTHLSNLKLYLLGMFYNLFLPGGIGGDAYKGYVIKQKFEVKTKRVVAVLVLDRLSGLLLLFIYSCLLLLSMNLVALTSYTYLIIILVFISILAFRVLNTKLFNYVLPVFWRSLGYSAIVQAAQLLCLIFILKALQIEIHLISYMFIFLISSIVAVLPLTIGGIGSREVVFFYGALWLGLDQNTSVSISMVFFLITAMVSLFGIVYHFKKPALTSPGGQ